MEATPQEVPWEPSGVRRMFYSNLDPGGGYASTYGKVLQAELVHFGAGVFHLKVRETD